MHIKGYILQLIERTGAMWDYDVAADVMTTYGLSGDYWHGTVRLTLTDLYSSGLLDETEQVLTEPNHPYTRQLLDATLEPGAQGLADLEHT
jgi:hypothetical protein